MADISGTREVVGLSAPVRVVRDRWGVPHIYAHNQDDLFFAQGFVQAQDRLFQMDLWRRSSLGRLAEVLGPNFAERDAMTRRIQYAGDPGAEWASCGSDAKSIATAFVRGVNAWVAVARERPPEEFVLAGWKPDVWAAEDLLNRTDAFVESRDAIGEIFRARLLAALGPRRVSELLPGEPAANVPQGLDLTTISSVVADAIRSAGAPPFFLGLAKTVTVRLKADTTYDTAPTSNTAPTPDTGPTPDTTSSVRGIRLQPDPGTVRTLAHPSLRYLVHLNTPGWNVIGATAPWLPGVAIGHNEQVAWEAEPVDADTQDVYVEKVNPANPHQVEHSGRWIDTEIIREPMLIRGRAKPFVFDREHTPHGVVVAVDRERHLAFTIRWSGTEPGACGALAALALDRASSLDELRGGVARWKMPARRFVYRDRDGHSGSTIAALVPVRRGWNGRLPAPGWTGTNEWIGWRRAAAADAESPMALLARQHSDRADVLLRDLQAAASGRDASTAQRALTVNAVADALREPGGTGRAAIFTHPLAISEAARRRFNIGPLRPASADARVFRMMFDTADWDRSTAMNAPGQSGSPDSAHFADLARMWREGKSIALVFTDRAVGESTESTLTLTPRIPNP